MKWQIGKIFTILLGAIALIFGVGTFALLSGSLPIQPTTDQILSLIYIDVALLLAALVIIIYKLVLIWSARRRGTAGAQIHSRLVLYFAALAAVPAILISFFSLLFFDLGLESWFSQRVRTAVVESQIIAESYLKEHNKTLESDTLQIALNLSRDAPMLESNSQLLERALNIHANLRGVTEAIIFNPTEDVFARVGYTFALEFEPIPQNAFIKADKGEVAVLDIGDNRLVALIKLETFLKDTYLLLARSIDPLVLEKAQRAETAVEQFQNLEKQRADVKISFVLAFLIVTLLLLIAAVWVGLSFAASLTKPISLLMAGTEAIRSGDLSARVPEINEADELGALTRAFNRMASQLENQRSEIISSSKLIDERRRFTEAVLSGVSAGVIGLDHAGRIDLPNKHASRLLNLELDELRGHELIQLIPEMSDLIQQAQLVSDDQTKGHVEGEIKIADTETAVIRTLYVRIGTEYNYQNGEKRIDGFVVTFDDITNLQSAQRKAAWADVAQRIAHEIKNPLTPIQLSAERLKRKYSRQIFDDKEIFETCTDTIIRHVEDIGRMVSEFSSFARMPKAQKKEENLTELCRQAVFLQKNAHRNIKYSVDFPSEPVSIYCDGRQISQILTNLLKNASEAMENKSEIDGILGHIDLEIIYENNGISVIIEDDGKGLPNENRDRIMEPYITTREKGTGLGLAIVKKIMEDHNGIFYLDDRPDNKQGTSAKLFFKLGSDFD